MKLKGWHFAAMGVGGAGLAVGIWYFIYRITETEVPPEQRASTDMAREMALKEGAVVTGYSKGKPFPLTLTSVGNNQFMRADAGKAWLSMQAAAKAAGFNLTSVSGFRSMEKQTQMYNERMMPGNKPNELAKKYGIVAKPGWSNHQDGTSIDIGNVGGFDTAAYAWLKANAINYGFVNDVKSEWWHWTYKLPPPSAMAGLAVRR